VSSIGFLWYNAHPRKCLCDVGSLALAGRRLWRDDQTGTSAAIHRRHFVIEARRYPAVGSYKLRKKRIQMPIHHHFERWLVGVKGDCAASGLLLVFALFARLR